MNRRLFSDIEQGIISKNINVLSVSSESITYNSGKSLMEIFKEVEFDINMIGNRVPVNTKMYPLARTF